MSKNVQIVETVTGMSKSLDVIASNVIAGNYTTAQLQEKLGSIANVLDTTASAQSYILGQVSDVESFSTVASTTDFDDTLSVVLSTQAQATLIGQMIKGTLGITAEDEADEEEKEEVTPDEVQEAVSFEEPKTEEKKETPAKTEAPAKKEEVPAKTEETKEAPKTEETPAKTEEKSDDKAMETEAKKLGTGDNHSEINSQVKTVEKSGANEVISGGADTNAPSVKTVASETAMSSEASTRPMVSWNFN